MKRQPSQMSSREIAKRIKEALSPQGYAWMMNDAQRLGVSTEWGKLIREVLWGYMSIAEAIVYIETKAKCEPF